MEKPKYNYDEVRRIEEKGRNAKHAKYRLVIDEWFNNGMVGAAAVRKIYCMDDDYDAKKASANLWLDVKKDEVTKEYMDLRMAEFRERMDVTKQKLIDQLVHTVHIWEAYSEMACRLDDLTPQEAAAYQRLKTLVTTQDALKARDMIAKMIGAYAPVEINANLGFTLNYVKPEKNINIDDVQEDDD